MPHVDVDQLARIVGRWGAQAAGMPPCWDGACISQPMHGPQGEPIGRMLPGRGLYLHHDLKALGITRRKIPHVFERTPIRRLTEMLTRARNGLHELVIDERAAITTYDGIIAARAAGNGEDRGVWKSSFTTVANVWSATWQAGGLPGAGAYSATPGLAPNNTTTGALSQMLSNPGSGSKYLLTFGFTSNQAINMCVLADLVCAVGGITANSNAAQTVSSAALTRYTTGAGVMAICDITTQLGATPGNFTLSSYTNSAGTAGQVSQSQAMLASGIVQRITPVATAPVVALASGDIGVRAVSTSKLSAAMGAGVYAINLFYILQWVPGLVANIYVERESTVQIDGINLLPVGTDNDIGALTCFVQTNTTTSGLLVGFFRTCNG